MAFPIYLNKFAIDIAIKQIKSVRPTYPKTIIPFSIRILLGALLSLNISTSLFCENAKISL